MTTTIYNSRNIYNSIQAKADRSYEPGEGYTSITIDASDKVHISYYDFISDDSGNLIYATNKSGSWVTITIDTKAGQYNSIAVDSSGNVHISYCLYGYSGRVSAGSVYARLRYATNASGKWVISTVDSSGNAGWYSSIALDSSGNVHISYSDQLNYVLKYATNVSGKWIITDLGSMYGFHPRYTSIAIDASDKVHIGYYGRYLTYVTNTSGKWVTEEVLGSANDDYVSIALDSSNNVHFSYLQSSYALDYAIKNSDSWIITTIDNGTWLNDCSLAIDSSGNSHISYTESSSDKDNLMYATNASGKWEISIVDSYGLGPSIALDSSGKVHISYVSGDSIKYATNKSGAWKSTIVDEENNYMYRLRPPSLAIDSSGKAHICYAVDIPMEGGFRTNALKYATNTSGSWVTTLVDDNDAGDFNSIALNSKNKAHISYYAHTSPDPDGKGNMWGGLKYATNASGSWKTSIIDNSAEYIGTCSSIAIDTSDKVHISYSAHYYGLIKYATNSSGSWLTTKIDTRELRDSGETSIKLDESDNAHISYYNEPSLKYATNASGSWITTTLDSGGGGFVGFINSIALDKFGKLHICYTDDSNGDIKYAVSTNQPTPIPVTMEASPAELTIRENDDARVYITVKGVDNTPVQGNTIKAHIKNNGNKLIKAHRKEQTTDVYGQAVFTFYAKNKGKTSVTFKNENLSIKVPVTIK